MIIYNSLNKIVGYGVTPAVDVPGTTSALLLTNYVFWNGATPETYANIDHDWMIATITSLVAASDPQIILPDIEVWATGFPHVCTDQVLTDYYNLTVEIQTAFPSIPVGWYAVYPTRSVYASRIDDAWIASEAQLLRLVNGVNPWLTQDYAMPSLYCFEPQGGFAGWKAAYEFDIAQAALTGKPVIPFIWPYFHPNGGATPLHTPVPYFDEILGYLRDQGLDAAIWWFIADETPPHASTVENDATWWRDLVYLYAENVGITGNLTVRNARDGDLTVSPARNGILEVAPL